MRIRQLSAKAEQLIGLTQQKWGELTHNQFTIIQGKRKSLLGKIKELHLVAGMMTDKVRAKSKN